MSELVARKYSVALFQVGKERNLLDTFSVYLEQLESILDKNTDIKRILFHPDIPRGEKKDLISTITTGFPVELQGFIQLLIDKKRESYLSQIVNLYKEMVKKHNNIIDAKVVTAVPLADSDRDALKENLSKLLKKEINIVTEVDPKILGGVWVQAGDRIIDGTIKGKLQTLKTELLQSSGVR